MHATRKPKSLGKTAPLPKSFVLGLATLAALGLAAAQPASAQTITFSGLPSQNGQTLSSPYQEGAYTVSFTSGSWLSGQAYGDPAPSIFSEDNSATIDVTNGGTFTFSSVDLSGNHAQYQYTLTGLLGGSTVFTSTGILPDQPGPSFGFTTAASSDPTAAIDDLRITLSSASPSSVNLDNIAVNQVVTATPEPSPVAAFALTGLGAAGLVLRARKRRGAA